MGNKVFITDFLAKVLVKTMAKGKDGSVWHLGNCSDILLCKKGDFCFDSETYNIYHCSAGGNNDTATWDFVCSLNNLDKITEFIKASSEEIDNVITDFEEKADILLSNLKDSPGYKPWWFGTRTEYNTMSTFEKDSFELFFVEEGT